VTRGHGKGMGHPEVEATVEKENNSKPTSGSSKPKASIYNPLTR